MQIASCVKRFLISLMQRSLFACGLLLFSLNVALACTEAQIDTTTGCVDTKFTVTTTELAANTTFKFIMTAVGTFYVDWGDGTGEVINRTDITETTYSHTYTTAGAKTIKFGGVATDYSTSDAAAAIAFNGGGSTSSLIASISGNLSTMFPYMPNNAVNGGAQPRFYKTFAGASNLTEIPSTLFSGYTTAVNAMFRLTFQGCTSITTIPAGLFANITTTTNANSLFLNTFKDCTSLITIPADLFDNISTGANNMFEGTFKGCTSLTTIPAGLFTDISTGAAYMFKGTFRGCTSLTTIPANLFANITTVETFMFNEVFMDCSALVTIPSGLFSNITWTGSYSFISAFENCTSLTTIPEGLFTRIYFAHDYAFQQTFKNCTSLTTIPDRLFGGIKTSKNGLFISTFEGCSSLTTIPGNLFESLPETGYRNFDSTFKDCTSLTAIPEGLFSKMTSVYNGGQAAFGHTFQGCTSLSGYISPAMFYPGLTGTNFMLDIFTDTNLDETCPAGTTEYTTGYESYWSPKVACVDNTPVAITLDSTGATTGPVPSTVYLKYKDGWYSDAAGGNQITAITTRPTKSGFSFAGFYTNQNGDGVQVIDGLGNFINNEFAAKPVTLYARWMPSSVFTITTTNLENNAVFKFNMSAAGTFHVNCGENGTLSGSNINGTEIVRSNSSEDTYTCTYSTGGVKTISFAGLATNYYSTSETVPAIRFGKNDDSDTTSTPDLIASISGNISTIFPQKSASAGNGLNEPRFRDLFRGATHITSIPSTLFSDYTIVSRSMYANAFKDCTSLTTIPNDLFANITSVSYNYSHNVFLGTFENCTSLTTIPAGLFDTITMGAGSLFKNTFKGCTSLTTIPEGLFSKFTKTHDYSTSSFESTFEGCTSLTTVPERLFGGLNASTVAGSMFKNTFKDCTSLTNTPGNLFATSLVIDRRQSNNLFEGMFDGCTSLTTIRPGLFSTGAMLPGSNMFTNTFRNCTSLTTIPNGLFTGVTTTASNMFNGTFQGCSSLTTIPSGLFAALTSSNPNLFANTFKDCTSLTTIPTGLFNSITSSASSMFSDTFKGCTKLTTIPDNLFANITTGADSMFANTFEGCTKLTTIPSGLFANITTSASSMFSSTFKGCTNLATIPGNLFTNITTGADSMFYYTFQNCTDLTAIPSGLVSNITTGYNYMFKGMFSGCSKLSGYISPTMFQPGLNGNDIMASIFSGTALATSCPSGTTLYPTGYEQSWNNKVACVEDTPIAITLDTTGATTDAVPSTVYVKYSNGWYSDSAGNTRITALTTRPTKSGLSFAGFFTGPNATGTKIIDEQGRFVNDIFTITPTTLYAYFTSRYTVTYSCGNGSNSTPPASALASVGLEFEIADGNLCEKDGYLFNKWAVSGTNDVYNHNFVWNYTENKTFTAQYIQGKFAIQTVNLAANSTIIFNMSAKGEFTVDCGEDGTLSGTGVTGNTITRDNTTQAAYTCTYSSGGVKTILFNGLATGYATSANAASAAINFYTDSRASIASMYGSLGAIFPTLGTTSGKQPIFYSLCQECSNLTTIPATLFKGVTGAYNSMFRSAFDKCTNLQAIPTGLFDGFSGKADHMFRSTFYNCSSITKIPDNLFEGLDGSANSMFKYTFFGCDHLTGYVPATLFAGASGTPTDFMQYIFAGGNSLATVCPTGTEVYTTGYEAAWNGKVACQDRTRFTITLDTTGATTAATPSELYLWYNYEWYEDADMTTTISALEYTPTKTGYVFDGFYTEQNGAGTKIIDEYGNILPDNLTFTESSTTIYAKFSNQYNVTYSCGTDATGTAPSATTAIGGHTFTPELAHNCAKTGYIFTGWAVSGTEDVVTDAFVWNYETDKTLTATWQEPKFSIITTNLASNTTFSFTISAAGTFFVNWGDGAITTITKSTTTETSYSHTYTSSGVKTIQFAGIAENYSDADNSTISFGDGNGTPELIAGISGNLSAMFPYIPNNAQNEAQPRFGSAFNHATNLTEIPATLFSGYTIAASSMFKNTFTNCTSLTTIPVNLFNRLVGGTDLVFFETFKGCSSLTSIPSGLFNGFSSGGRDMFRRTFQNCTSLASIPAGFFSHITSGGDGIFISTFSGCSALTTIPGDLFSGITITSPNMFAGAFENCTSLTSIPDGLFSNITSGNNDAFQNTFKGCTSLSGYISPTMFQPGLSGNNIMIGIFTNTNLDETCPANTEQYITGYESYWDTKVSCVSTLPMAITLNMVNATTNATPSTIYMRRNDKWYADANASSEITALTSKPVKSGFIFAGFYTQTNGEGTQIIDIDGNITSDTTFTAEPTTIYANWISAEFSLNTTNLNADTVFKFKMSAAGTFYVDWGDGMIEMITRENTNETTYSHTYTTAGVKTIQFGGTASNYSSTSTVAAIRFGKVGASDTNVTPELIASVSGNLSSIFPYITNNAANGAQPRFSGLLGFATNLTEIPATLFSGYTTTSDSMFRYAFTACNSITAIPATLFSNISTVAASLFEGTFAGCTSLTTIPGNLFSNITTAESGMFSNTFAGCTSLTTIPSGLFSNIISGAPGLFSATFRNCTSLTIIPSNLFAGITTGVASLFEETFYGCTSLTTIPHGLFSNLTTGATYMFNATFYGCTTLVNVPVDLFATINTGGNNMFYYTFSGCSALAGYVSPTLFKSGLTGTDLMTGVFHDTALDEACPSGTEEYTTGYESYWESKVACYIPAAVAVTLNTTGATTGATPSTVYVRHGIGWYSDSDGTNTITALTTVPTKTDSQFVGFYSAQNGAGYQIIDANGRFVNNNFTTSAVTIYAHFVQQYTVTYLCGTGASGTPPANEIVVAGDVFSPASGDTCTKANYVFAGWAVSGTEITVQSAFTWNYTEDKTFVAQWDLASACTGTTYEDSGNCIPCPHGYTASTSSGKTSIYQCKIQCPGGTWTEQYTKLTYLQGDGVGTYIDTGYSVTSTNVVVNGVFGTPTTMSGSSSNSGNFFGNVADPPKNGFSSNYKGGLFGFWNNVNSAKVKSATQAFTANTQYAIDYTINGKSRTMTVNGTMTTDSKGTATESINTFKLFSNGGATMENGEFTLKAGDMLFSGRIYSLKLYDGGDLVLNMIPARRNSDNVLGMYNLADGTFYTNAGTGTFTAGAVDSLFGGGTCINVGDGYWAPANTTNFGSISVRNQCPGGVATGKENASSVSECLTGATSIPCNAGYYLPAGEQECAQCLINSYCVGGQYEYSDVTNQGIQSCSANLRSPAGSWEQAQCGRILHIGDNIVYLRSVKKTTPSLNVMLDGTVFYGNMTTNDVVMHSGTERKLKLQFNNTTYSVYDDTVEVGP